MTASYEVSQVFIAGRLILYEYEQEIETESRECFLVATVINGAQIWNAITLTVIGDNCVNQ